MLRSPKALKAATPLPDAARQVLAYSLGQVGVHLKQAQARARLAPEAIHQLRVGTRRASAQIDVFACCLPRRVHRQARRVLRALRRAAGDARDADVFIHSLAESATGGDALLGYALAQREAAHASLLDAVHAALPQWAAIESQVLQAVRPPRQARVRTLADLARSTLEGLVAALDTAAQCDLKDPAQLHRVRIAGKRLRYALEVFAEALGPTVPKRILPALAQMQALLGQAHDSTVAHARLSAMAAQLRDHAPQHWARHQPGLAQLKRHCQRQQPRARREFAAWWAHWQLSGRTELQGLLED